MSALTPRVEAWSRRGKLEVLGERRIWVLRRDGAGPLVVYLHGFPSSSYDWRGLLAQEADQASIASDFLGFGLSEKPRRHRYSLFEQADIVEQVVGASEGPVVICAHDMGTSVANELMARDLEGRLGFRFAGALLFNGSMVVERASLTSAQKALLSPAGPLVGRLTNRPFFRAQFGVIFSDAHPLGEEEAADQWSVVCANGGRTLGHKLISYVRERREHADRWHGAIRDWPGELHLAWGLQDPVATTAVLETVRELRPQAPLTELPDLGHYPQIEDPARLLPPLRRLVDATA